MGECWTDEGDSWGDAFVGHGTAYQPKVALVATSKGGGDGFPVSLTLSFEKGETGVVSLIPDDFRQRWMLAGRSVP